MGTAMAGPTASGLKSMANCTQAHRFPLIQAYSDQTHFPKSWVVWACPLFFNDQQQPFQFQWLVGGTRIVAGIF